MFTIYGGKTEFEQWDLDQLITCDCLKEGDEVVFSGHGKTYETTAFTQDGKVWADVPNFLLKEPGSFRVDLGWGLSCHMDCRTTFTVTAKDKPEGYVCGENIKHRESKSGGVTSWNDLKDKPFGELPTGGDTLTWDGNTEGLVVFGELGVPAYKVSDAVPTEQDFANGFTWTLNDGTVIQGEGVSIDGPLVFFCDVGFVISQDVAEYGIVHGVYFVSYNGQYPSSLTIPGYTGFPVTKKIEEKYLPWATVLYTDGTYLYNTEDTTDESNRTTKAELLSIVQSGRLTWIFDNVKYIAPMGCLIAENFGVIWNPTLEVECFTAEYTPAETTGE